LWRVRATIVAVEKQQLLFTKCVFVAVVIQHTMRAHRVILSSMACPALQHVSTFIMNVTIAEKMIDR